MAQAIYRALDHTIKETCKQNMRQSLMESWDVLTDLIEEGPSCERNMLEEGLKRCRNHLQKDMDPDIQYKYLLRELVTLFV